MKTYSKSLFELKVVHFGLMCGAEMLSEMENKKQPRAYVVQLKSNGINCKI